MLRLCGLLVGIEPWGGPPLALPPLGHHCPTSITPLCLPTSCCLAVLCFCLSAPSPHLPIPLSRRSADADLRRVLTREASRRSSCCMARPAPPPSPRPRAHPRPARRLGAGRAAVSAREAPSLLARSDGSARTTCRMCARNPARRAHVASEITRTGDIGGVAFGGIKRAGGDAKQQCERTAPPPPACASGVPRVRSNFRFRNRGTEYVSEYGVKWKRGGATRQCDRALGAPPRLLATRKLRDASRAVRPQPRQRLHVLLVVGLGSLGGRSLPRAGELPGARLGPGRIVASEIERHRIC